MAQKITQWQFIGDEIKPYLQGSAVPGQIDIQELKDSGFFPITILQGDGLNVSIFIRPATDVLVKAQYIVYLNFFTDSRFGETHSCPEGIFCQNIAAFLSLMKTLKPTLKMFGVLEKKKR